MHLSKYGKYPKISITLFHIFGLNLFFMQLFSKILSGMAKRVNPDQIAPPAQFA